MSFQENLQIFTLERHKLLHVLENLSLEQWNRSARITGKTNIFTVFGETLRMAQHELEHHQQSETLLSGK